MKDLGWANDWEGKATPKEVVKCREAKHETKDVDHGRYGNYKGGRIHDSHGYIRVLKKGHPRQNNAGYVLEHLLVMEKILGRPVEKTEQVHHKNGRRDDNRPENLELWRTKHPKGVRAADYHCAGCRCPCT